MPDFPSERENITTGAPSTITIKTYEANTKKANKLKISILTFCGLGTFCLISLLIGVFLMLAPTSSEEIVNFEVPIWKQFAGNCKATR